jgi:hypothetical protein
MRPKTIGDNPISMTLKLSPELRDAFSATCIANDRSASQTLRDFMREYIHKHAQGDLLKQPARRKTA